MKIGEAQKIYRENRSTLIEQRKELQKQRDTLEKKMAQTVDGREAFAKEAVTLELSLRENSKKFDANQEILDQLAGQYAAVWNAEVARQQGDVMEKATDDMVKIMEVARRISRGARVPAEDEQKLMEYSMELYLASKNLACMREAEKREEYDSLWQEEESPEEYDPQGKAENATAYISPSADTGLIQTPETRVSPDMTI